MARCNTLILMAAADGSAQLHCWKGLKTVKKVEKRLFQGFIPLTDEALTNQIFDISNGADTYE